MEKTNLYDMPKDMLVKLISTIRDDTIKEIRNEYEAKYKEIEAELYLINEVSYNSAYPIDIEKCSYPGCKSMSGNNGRDADVYYECDHMYYCV